MQEYCDDLFEESMSLQKKVLPHIEACKDIMIVSGREHCGDILNLLGSGRDMGLKLSYEIQDDAGGIAHALSLAERFVGTSNVAVCLGDNIFDDEINLTGYLFLIEF